MSTPSPALPPGRVVLVTGGTRGIGRAIAERFLEAGADVLVCGRNAPAEPPVSAGRQAVFVAADVREWADAERLVAMAVERFGRLDILVNNAGGSPYAPAATASPRLSARVIELNLIAPLYLSQHAHRVMRAQDGGGVIVNIASVSGTRPSPGTAAYGAAKAGLINLTRTLAVEWAPEVRVNAVAAGLVRTEQAHLHYGDAEAVARVAATVPLGRMAEPRDVAEACVFLASPAAAYVTGACLVVDGGGEWPAFLRAAGGPGGGAPGAGSGGT